MYRKSSSNRQTDVFSSFEAHLSESKRKRLNDPKAWHSVFCEHVTSQVDEDMFSVLYSDSRGRPNAPVRILVAMLILKEAYGWSDEQLLDQCNFNVLVMRALGLANLNDEVPVASTYYLFKQSLFRHQVACGRDLMAETFENLTKMQVELLGVRGELIRMDSKLIGSNIANCCRLRHVIGTLQAFWSALSPSQRRRAPKEDQALLDTLLEQTPGQFVYRLSDEEKASKIEACGQLLLRLCKLYDESDSDRFGMIHRLLSDQFIVRKRTVVVRPPGEIPSGSLQSPHDPDAAFSAKAHQKVKGYSVNVTETCNPDGLNLITDVRVEPANHSDQKFLQPALEATEAVVGTVAEVSVDGAYYNPTNADLADENGKRFHFGGMQGTPSHYTYERTPEGLKVTDTRTGEMACATEYKPGRYRADLQDRRRPYYFRESQVKSSERRQTIQDLSEAIRQRRNNVEATVFQLSFFTRNNKTRYRGLRQNRLWAVCRAAWINIVRIKNYIGDQLLNPAITRPLTQNPFGIQPPLTIEMRAA